MRTPRRTGAPWPLLALALVSAVGFAFPGIYLVWRNFTEGADPAGLLLSDRTLPPLWRTLRLAVAVAATAAIIGSALAWLTTRTDLPLRRFWRVLLPLPLVFPTFIGAAAFIQTLNPGGLANDLVSRIGVDETPQLQGFLGAWLVLSLFTYPYVYLPVAARLRQLPRSLEESARVLGDGPWRVYLRVCGPQIHGSVTAGTLLVFLYAISDFGAVQLMRYDTLTRAIATNQLARPPVALALSLVLLVLAAIVVLAERYASRLVPTTSPARPDSTAIYPLGRWRIPSAMFVVTIAFFAVGAPLIAIIDWSGDGIWNRGDRSLTIDGEIVLEATRHTVSASLVAALVAVLAVLPVALLVGRYRSRFGNLAHTVVISTFALPGILIALSLRFWTLRSDVAFDWFSDTLALLVFAYVVRFGSLAVGATVLAVEAVPMRLHDAARTLGAGPLRRFATIDLRLMAPGLVAGGGLVLLSTMKELPISLLIAPIGYSTLTTRIFGSFTESFVTEAGLMALVLVACSFVLSWFLVVRRAEHL